MIMSTRPFLTVLCCGVLAAGLTGSARQGAAPLPPLVLPAGFQADVFADKVENARSMVLGPQGTIFVGSQYVGKVHAVVDSDGDHKVDRVVVIASGLDQPDGVAMRNGALYVATASRLLRFDDIEKHLDAPPAPVTVRDDLPNPKQGHTWKFIAFASALAEAQQVVITRSGSRAGRPGPAENFTGGVRVEMLFEALDPSHASGGSVSFEPGARTAWHTHPRGQILIVTAGTGRVQRWGDPIQEIRAGDVARIPAGQKHWHGAAPQASMTHVAITEHQDGTRVEWMEKVSDEQYNRPSNPNLRASRKAPPLRRDPCSSGSRPGWRH